MDTKHHITLAEVTPVFPPYRSGMGTVAKENARMAIDGGYETVVFTPWYRSMRASAARFECTNGMRVERLMPLFSYGNAALTPALLWKLRRADVIHLHYPALGFELTVLFWTLFGKKLVLTYHMDLVGKGRFMRTVFRLYSKLFLGLLLSRASGIFFSSRDYAESSPLIQPYLSRMEKKIVELPNSVDTERFKPSSVSSSSEQIGGDTPYILFVGALDSAHYSKGVTVLLDAFGKIVQHDFVTLVIIGDGDLRHEYEQYAHDRGIADRVMFIGSVGHDDLPTWYARSLCVVLPSTDETEAFGVVLIEAAACGTPGIATRLPGVRSVIDHGVTGFLVEPRDVHDLAEKITTMLSDRERAVTMGRAARARVEARYAYNKVSERFIRSLGIYLS